MSNATTKTVGIALLYGTAGSAAATPLAGIKEFPSLPNLVFDEYDNSWVDQTSKIKSFVMTLADGGTLGLLLAMQAATLTTLYGLFDGIDRSWKITFSTGATL